MTQAIDTSTLHVCVGGLYLHVAIFGDSVRGGCMHVLSMHDCFSIMHGPWPLVSLCVTGYRGLHVSVAGTVTKCVPV